MSAATVAELVRAIEAGELDDEAFSQLPSDVQAAVERALDGPR